MKAALLILACALTATVVAWAVVVLFFGETLPIDSALLYIEVAFLLGAAAGLIISQRRWGRRKRP